MTRVTPSDVTGRIAGLVAAGPGLQAREARGLAEVLGSVGARFLDDADPIRSEALARLPAESGLSPEMSVAVLDGMARDWTAERLLRLLVSELDEPAALDGFVDRRGRRVRALGPRLCVQIVAGSVPGVGVGALLRTLLVKAPTLLKPGRGDVALPELFARALREADPAVGDAVAVVYWPGGTSEVERAALAEAEVATVYGSDETVERVRALTPVTTRLVAYHHRVSVGAVGRDAMTGGALRDVVADVARSVALFDQRGCVSPLVVHVEEGDLSVGDFAEALAGALAALEATLPGGALDIDEAAALQQLRGTVELMGTGAGLWHGGPEASWTVVMEPDPGPDVACAGRVVRVRPLPRAEVLPSVLEPLGRHLQTLAVAGFGDRLEALATACARVGVTRIAPFAAVAFPPAWWLHDGRGPLTELVRWVEMEGSGP